MTSKAPPSRSLPPVPPGGGSSKNLVVVVLLGVGLVALILWKTCGKPDTPTVVTPIISSTADAAVATVDPRIDDIPPPPAIEDSGPEAGPTHVASTTWGCDAKKCGGAVTPDLETALAFRAKQAHRCYDSALAQDSTLEGKVTISVRIGGGGAVCGANVASNDLSNPKVGECIANMFRGTGHFPPPKGGCLDANVPISLMPPGQR